MRVCHDRLHLIVVRFYLFAQGFQQFGRGIPYPAGKEAMLGLQVHIVASAQRLAPTLGSYEHPKPLLIRSLVFRETRIAVDTPDTVFGLQVADSGVILAQTMDELRGEVHEAIVAGLVLRLVGIEPLAVIIHRKLREEGKN